MAVCSIGVSDVNSIPERVFSSAFQIFDQVTWFVGGSILGAVLKDEDDRLSLPETRIVLSIFLPIRVQQEQVKPDQQRSSRPLIKSSLSLINKYRSWSRQSFTQWTGKRTATSERRTLSLDFALPPRSASPCTGKSSSSPVSWVLPSFSSRFKFQPE